MFERIIVPLDGSKGAERAIPVAARIARASGGSIVFVRVVLPPVDLGKFAVQHNVVWEREAYQIHRAQAASYLAGVMLTHASDLVGIDTDLVVASGLAAPTICSCARLEHANLIVMCSHGETGLMRWMFGSVAQEIARHSIVPVLILQERGAALPVSRTAHPFHFLVVLDGSPLSESAIAPAVALLAALAEPAEGTLHLVRVVDLPATHGILRSQTHIRTIQEADIYLRAVVHRLQVEMSTLLKFTITTSVAIGTDAANTWLRSGEQAVSPERFLIVLATEKHGALRRLFAGSVSEKILSSTRLPLLVVRPHDAPAEFNGKRSNTTSF